MPILADGRTRTEKDSPDEEVEVVLEVDVVVAEVAGVEVSSHLLCQVDLSSC